MMRKIFLSTFIWIITFTAFAQNNTAKYDSTRNYLGCDAMQYAGQELLVAELPDFARKLGYENFYYDPNVEQKSFSPKKYGDLTVPYDSIVGHHYKVLEVFPDPKASQSFMNQHILFLKLEDLKVHDICYFRYDTSYSQRERFPFIVTGYMTRLKQKSIGREFVFSDAVFKTSKDYETDKPLTLVTGDKWKCVDVILDKKMLYHVSLLLQNTAGQKQTVTTEWAFEHHPSGAIYTAEEADKYRKLYGADFDIILKGNVKVGWSGTMCSLSWGNPDHVNSSITSAGRTEQWVYSDNHFLYFDNLGKLTAIQ